MSSGIMHHDDRKLFKKRCSKFTDKTILEMIARRKKYASNEKTSAKFQKKAYIVVKLLEEVVEERQKENKWITMN